MDWAAPDVSTPVGPPPAPVGLAPPRQIDGAATRRLGPSTAFDILDGAFTILRRAPGTVLGLTAIFVVPTQMLAAYMMRNINAAGVFDILESGDTSLLANNQPSSGAVTSLALLATLAPSLALVFVAAGLTKLVSAWQVGHDLTIGELLGGMRRLAWPLVASLMLVKAAELVGLMLCALPALAVMAWFLVTAPAIAAEGLGPVEGMRRSARLASRRFWPVLGIGVLSAIVTQFVGFAIELVPQVVLWITGADTFSWVVAGLAGAVTAVLTTPIVAGTAVLTYLDLRVRTEGLDLELDAIDAFPDSA